MTPIKLTRRTHDSDIHGKDLYISLHHIIAIVPFTPKIGNPGCIVHTTSGLTYDVEETADEIFRENGIIIYDKN